jgi:phage shock protein PspC (stress-responsive transcriptional regulator)
MAAAGQERGERGRRNLVRVPIAESAPHPGAGATLHHVAAQLTRSTTDRVIAGVAGGIAERSGLSPALVRAAWVVSIFVGGLGILVYLVLWIALPEDPAKVPAIRIAEERYARGEVSAEELRQIRSDLQSGT